VILQPGAIEIWFDPLIVVGPVTVSWQAMGVVVSVLLALSVAALIGSRHAAPARVDDLAYIALAIIPGAVIGGRLVHAVVFWPAYSGESVRLLDPELGSLSLLGAVLGGALTGGYVARLLGGSVGRWAMAASLPMLLALGLGKIAQFLGGSGQGVPIDGFWAVAFMGPGPWVSAAPDMPSHPSQLHEAAWMLLGAAILLRPASRPTGIDPREGRRLFGFALGWFLAGRVLVGFTWRDEHIAGALNAEQVLALVGLVILIALALGLRIRAWREGRLPA
jgi:phosphatidylglycerol---prolipoprotein diacylglyceryl transferase